MRFCEYCERMDEHAITCPNHPAYDAEHEGRGYNRFALDLVAYCAKADGQIADYRAGRAVTR